MYAEPTLTMSNMTKKLKKVFLERLPGEKNTKPIQPHEERLIDSAYNRRWLLQCAVQGDTATMSEMIDKGVTPNFQSPEGKSALQIAVDSNSVELIKILMKSHKLNPNLAMKETGLTPLMVVCNDKKYTDRTNIVKFLLKIQGININLQDKAGLTALCHACNTGDLQLVQTLVTSSPPADVNLGPVIEGKIHGSLYYAKQNAFVEIVSYLESFHALEFPTQSEINKLIPTLPSRISKVHSRPQLPILNIAADTPRRHKSSQYPLEPLIRREPSRSVSMCLSTTQSKHEDILEEVEEETDNADTENRRLLLEALQEENTKKITELIAKGTNPNFTDEAGQTPLLIAVEKTNPELVRALLSSPLIDVNLPDELTGSYPIIAAAKNYGPSRLEILKMLLAREKDINIDAQDNEGYTALIFACIYGDLEVAQHLVTAGADLNLGNEGADRIETPLYHAKVQNQDYLIPFLESHGGEEGLPFSLRDAVEDVNIVSTAGATPINVVTIPKMEVPEDTKSDTRLARSLVLLKVRAMESKEVNNLLAKGVDPNHVDEQEETPLLVAIEKRSVAMIKLLLSSPKLNINLQNEDTGETPLLVAAKLQGPNKLEVVKTLLQGEGIQINFQDNDGKTALYIASETGDYDLCKLLLECGADPTIPKKSTGGRPETPLDIAKHGKHANIVTLLQPVTEKIKPVRAVPGGLTSSSSGAVISANPKKEEEPSKADNKMSRSKLLLDSKKGNIKAVRMKLDQGVNPNFIADDGETPLLVAIEKKDINMVKLLLSNPKIDPNLCDEDFGEPPLFVAIKLPSSNEKLEIIKLLLQTPGIIRDNHDKGGTTPMALATQSGDTEVSKLLSDSRILPESPLRRIIVPEELNFKGFDSPSRPLTPAPNRPPPTKGLKAKLMTSTTHSNAPSYTISPPSRAKVLERSLTDKADLRSPIGGTRDIKNVEIFKLTESLDGKPKILDGKSSEGVVVKTTPEGKGVEKVESKLADTKWNRSLLLINAKKSDTRAMRKLLEKGVSPNFVDEEGNSPISVSIEHSNLEGVKLLLSFGMDINLSDEMSGVTPLMCAAQIKGPQRIEIIKLLLQTGVVNINAQDEEGRTALVIAALSGDIEVAKLLVEANGDVNLGRSAMETPLHYAKASSNKELIALFNPQGTPKDVPKPFETIRERTLRQTLSVLKETSSRRDLFGPMAIPTATSPKFSEKLFVRVPVRDPVKDVIIGRGWKRFLYLSDENNTAILCYDINTNLEVPELKIDFAKILRPEKRDLYNEPNKFAFMFIPLKVQLAATTQKGRDIWIQIIMHFCKELRAATTTVSSADQPKPLPVMPPRESKPRLITSTEDTEENRSLLFQKVSSGDRTGVSQLLEKKVSLNFVNNGKTCLGVAIENGDTAMLRRLLSTPKIDVNIVDEKGTPLIAAIKHQEKAQLVPLILKTQGINVNNVDKMERSPLMISALLGDVEITKLLLEAKADINYGRKSPGGGNKIENALYCANVANNPRVATLLQSYGATPSSPSQATSGGHNPVISVPAGTERDETKEEIVETSPKRIKTPRISLVRTLDPREATLIQFVKDSNVHGLVDFIKQNGWDLPINFHDDQGRTPLSIGVEKSEKNLVRLLLRMTSVNVNMPDRDGANALIHSILSNHGPERLQIIELLVRLDGINVNYTDSSGRTALVHSVVAGDVEACKLLLKAGADRNLGKRTRERIETPMYLAKLGNNRQIIGLLLTGTGEDVETPSQSQPSSENTTQGNSNEYNKKLLLLSAKKADIHVVADLIKKGVDPNYIDRTSPQQTSLQVAIESQNLILLRLLLRSPLIDVNIRFSDVMCTPLISASKQKNARIDMVKSLLQCGDKIDVNAPDKNGRTALTYACFLGDEEVVKVLIEARADVKGDTSGPKKTEPPLFFARKGGRTNIIELLKSYGALDRNSAISPNSSNRPIPLKSVPTIPTVNYSNNDHDQSLSRTSLTIDNTHLTSPKAQKYRTSPVPQKRNHLASPRSPGRIQEEECDRLEEVDEPPHVLQEEDV